MKQCKRLSRFGWLLLVGLIGAWGCGNGNAGPATYPVTGVVRMDAMPVAGANVQFTPLDGATGAQAKTDEAGRFDVSILLDMGRKMQRGLPPGDYAISITKLEAPNSAKPPKNILPKKYADPKSSGFQANVSADGTNHVELPLTP